jgi:hypothetical protein
MLACTNASLCEPFRAYPTICADLNLGDALGCNADGKTGPASCMGGAKKPPDSFANLCAAPTTAAQLPARNKTLLGMAALLALVAMRGF